MVFLVRSNAVNGSQHDPAFGECAVDLRAHLPRLPASSDPHYGLIDSAAQKAPNPPADL